MRKYDPSANEQADAFNPGPFDEELAETPIEAFPYAGYVPLPVAEPEIPANDTITALVPTAITDIATIFTPGGADPILREIRAAVDKVRPLLDVSTVKGRELIRSTARKVATTKARLEDLGKAQADKAKELPKQIDAERRRIKEDLEALQDDVRAPLTAFEEKEKARVEGHEKAISEIFEARSMSAVAGSVDIETRITYTRGLHALRFFQEFEERSEKVRTESIKELEHLLDMTMKAEAERAELERLREAENARLEKEREAEQKRLQEERDERIRKEEAARVQRLAEEAAEMQRRDAEQRAENVRKEAADALRRAEEEKAAALQREQDAIAEQERLADLAEVNRVAAEARHKRELDEAAENERKRLQAIADAEAVKAANKAHQKRFNNDILAHVKTVVRDETDAKNMATDIIKGLVPHVEVKY